MNPMSLDEQVSLLMRGTEYGDEALKQAMAGELRSRLMEAQRERRSLRVYCGFDPRTSDLHLGHTVPMRKMQQFQDLGHEVIFVVGTFTSLIGDPSDQDLLRPRLSLEQARANGRTYADQAFKILDPKRTSIEFNDTWLSQLKFSKVFELASHFTIQQFLARETFRKRFEAGAPIFVHEFFYALMQAYDAYHLRADVQIGGSDQLFNIVSAGRKMMEALGVMPNIGIILGILPGTDGVVKMSKSLGNHIPLNTTPEDMYGKVMSIPDAAMGSFIRLVTRWAPDEIDEIERGMKAGELHPRDVKMRLAREIVSIYYGDKMAKDAEGAFRRVFQERTAPEIIEEIRVEHGTLLATFLLSSGAASSKSDARRLILQGAVHLGEDAIEDPNFRLELDSEAILKVGKRRFLRVIPVPRSGSLGQ